MFGCETGQAVGPGTCETVDGLLGITHHTDVGTAIDPQRHQTVLDGGDVLVFIDHEVPVGGADLLSGSRTLCEQRCRAQEDVIEVDHPRAELMLLVGLHHLGHAFRLRPRNLTATGKPSVLTGRDVAGLGPADLSDQVPHQIGVGVSQDLIGGTPHQREGVVEQRRELRPVGRRPEVAALAQSSGVDGAGRHPPHPEPGQPRLQLACRPGGERDCERRCRGIASLPDGVSHPVRDGPGLSRARPCQHNQGPVQQHGNLPLFGVKGIEDRITHVHH